MASKPPLIVRLLLWLFGADADGELIAYLREQQTAAETAHELDVQRRRHRQGGSPMDDVFPPAGDTRR